MGLQGNPLCDFEELEIELVFPAYQYISPLALCGGFSSSGALYLRYVCVSDGIRLHHRAGRIKGSQREEASPTVRGPVI